MIIRVRSTFRRSMRRRNDDAAGERSATAPPFGWKFDAAAGDEQYDVSRLLRRRNCQ